MEDVQLKRSETIKFCRLCGYYTAIIYQFRRVLLLSYVIVEKLELIQLFLCYLFLALDITVSRDNDNLKK